ncbi:MAG: hypothetical protein IIA75_02525, partial [Proteobacteria bacterium]|nr:hypothetical protein [Pseudomonadota bacterium]
MKFGLRYCNTGHYADPVRAIELMQAGEAAYTVFAWEEAALHWQAALELMEEQGSEPERRARLLERLGDLMYATELNTERGIDCLEQALRIYEDLKQTKRV